MVNIAVGWVVLGDARRSHDRAGGGWIARKQKVMLIKLSSFANSKKKKVSDRHECLPHTLDEKFEKNSDNNSNNNRYVAMKDSRNRSRTGWKQSCDDIQSYSWHFVRLDRYWIEWNIVFDWKFSFVCFAKCRIWKFYDNVENVYDWNDFPCQDSSKRNYSNRIQLMRVKIFDDDRKEIPNLFHFHNQKFPIEI